MEQIIAALITAVSAVVVALISRTPTKTVTGVYVPRLRGSSHGKWVAAMAVLASWLVISPIAIHHDFPTINVFALLALTAVVAAIWPINGWEAAAWVFSLHALNSVGKPIALIVTGYHQNPFSGYPLSGVLLLTTLALANALGVALLSQWRLRTGLKSPSPASAGPTRDSTVITTTSGPSDSIPQNTPDLSVQLERLTRLHESGGLSEVEFVKAKERILGGLD